MKLAILGAGGHGRVVADAASLSDTWSDIVFFDGNYPDLIKSGRWPVVGKFEDLVNNLETLDAVIVGVGNCEVRNRLTRVLQERGANLITIIHPTAVISSGCSISVGSAIFANSVINYGSIVGQAVIINTAATIDHDCQIADGVHISPGANLAGEVVVGENSWVGIGAVVKQQVAIGSDVIIGAGAAVVSDISDGKVAVGIPANTN